MSTRTTLRALRFSATDAERAFDAWGANCGPGALAAVSGLPLDGVREHLRSFDQKRYTNPSMMLEALRSLQIPFRLILRPPATSTTVWPQRLGLVRVQWTGPWTAPGVPIRVRYRHTHWIAAARTASDDIGVFDINCMDSGGWVSLASWIDVIVPYLTRAHSRADGGWHQTHVVETVAALGRLREGGVR